MADAIERLARGNVTEVKVVLASVLAALAVYQLALIAVGYGRLRLVFLGWGPATRAHRILGDVVVILVVVVSVACLAVFGFDDDGAPHALSGAALGGVLALKVLVVRRSGGHSRLLPVLGATIFVLLAFTWWTSAGSWLGGGE